MKIVLESQDILEACVLYLKTKYSLIPDNNDNHFCEGKVVGNKPTYSIQSIAITFNSVKELHQNYRTNANELKLFGTLAQSVEQETFNLKVVGSIPTGSTVEE